MHISKSLSTISEDSSKALEINIFEPKLGKCIQDISFADNCFPNIDKNHECRTIVICERKEKKDIKICIDPYIDVRKLAHICNNSYLTEYQQDKQTLKQITHITQQQSTALGL